jgi:hypothetical protein
MMQADAGSETGADGTLTQAEEAAKSRGLNAVEDTASAETSPVMIELPAGDSLDSSSARFVTTHMLTRLIILAGAADSGKTTLLATIYELFQDGPFAGYVFAGSRTLPGFERRSHLARIASGRSHPDTERTKSAEEGLLHLKVKRADGGRQSRDLLFTDLSGERFRLIKDSTDECMKFDLLKRADHLVVLIDGDKICQMDRRLGAITDTRMLLRSCLDAGMIGAHSFVDIAVTKYDLLVAPVEQVAALDFVRTESESLRKDFETRVARLRVVCVAARQGDSSLPTGYQLDNLFRSWVEDHPIRRYVERSSECTPSSTREIDRFRA